MVQKNENPKDLVDIFSKYEETLIWSYTDGIMGLGYEVREAGKVVSAMILINDFIFFAGKPDEELVAFKPDDLGRDFMIMVPENDDWAKLIEKHYKEDSRKVTRYAIKKEKDIFDKAYLKGIVDGLDKTYRLRLIREEDFDRIIDLDWGFSLCDGYIDFEQFNRLGLGVIITHKDEIVAGASSYSVYGEGIEIEIDTKPEYRRKGLALICGAKLILECMKRKLYPSWDAQNLGSVELSKKLGYHFKEEYTAYEVTNY